MKNNFFSKTSTKLVCISGLVIGGLLLQTTTASAAEITEDFDVQATVLELTGGESIQLGETTYGNGTLVETALIQLKPMSAKGYDLKGSKTKVSLVVNYVLTPEKERALKKEMKKQTLKWKHKFDRLVAQGKRAEALKLKRPTASLVNGAVAQDRGKYVGKSGIRTYTHSFGKAHNSGSERTTKYMIYDLKTGKLIRIDCNNEIKAVNKKDKLTQFDVTYESKKTYELEAASKAMSHYSSYTHFFGKSNNGNCVIDIYQWIDITATSDVVVKGRGSTVAKARISSTGKINEAKVSASIKEKLSADATTKTSTEISYRSSLFGKCKYNENENPQAQAPLVSIEKANDLDVTKPNTTNDPNWEPSRQTIRVNYDFGTGTGTVFVNSDFGTVGVYDPTQKRIVKSSYENLSGRGFVDVTYVASTEAGTDKVSAHGVSNESKLRSDIVTSNTFIVNPSPVHPL